MDRKTQDTALLLIDVISDFSFDGGATLLARAAPVAQCIRDLKKNLAKRGVPIIYANDNFGKWRSDFRAQVERCLRKTSRGAEVVRLLHPGTQDYFILKPKHSAFYSTNLALLLEYLKIKRLVLAGWATGSCILFTANDAYMRDFELIVPPDCVASFSDFEERYALHHFEHWLKASILPSETIVKNFAMVGSKRPGAAQAIFR